MKDLKIGDKVQVWREIDKKYFGWATVIAVSIDKNGKVLAGAHLQDYKQDIVLDDKVHFLTEDRAFRVLERIEKDLDNG